MNATLSPDALLAFPLHQRTVVQYATGDDGVRELRLYHDGHEVSFDEPELFAFGEALARHGRFVAGSAVGWGEGYRWPRIRLLLEQLIEAGLLVRAEEEDDGDAAPDAPDDLDRPSPLPPAPADRPRTWAECEAITAELTGRAIEPGYLELVVPVFRVAHIALDADGRQVGEGNVYPQPLRLDVPTRWRTCIYPGSRFRDPKPMNVSALKAMRAHWPETLAALQRIRAAYLDRFPPTRAGWTVAELERLATLVLALPTWQLVRSDGRVDVGALHPVLSAMFRVTDGLRMTTHHMLFVPVAEATLAPDAAVDSRQVLEHAERNFAFHSTHGVCAGPRSMIEQFLAVLVDGRPAPQVALPAAVDDALAAIPDAFDYGLLGLQAHAVVFSLWPAMTRTYERLWEIVQPWPEPSPLRRQLAARIETLRKETLHATEAWRRNREEVYEHLHAHCAEALDGHAVPVLTLAARMAAAVAAEDPALDDLDDRLRALLGRRLPDAGDRDVARLAACLAEYFRRAQALVARAVEVQSRINALVGRPQPARPFSAADVDVHVRLQGNEARRLPQLIDELDANLGFRAEITAERIRIHFAGMVPADPPCDTARSTLKET